MTILAGPRREVALLGASTALYPGGRFVLSLVAAKTLEPSDFTTWALIAALLAYSPSLALGVPNGMSRELPVFVALNDANGVRRSIAVTWTATACAAVLGFLATVLTAVVVTSSVAALVGVLVAGTIVFTTQQFLQRARLRFGAASAHQAALGTLLFAGSGWLYISGASGLLPTAGAYALAITLAVFLGLFLGPRPQFAGWQRGDLLTHLGVGFPIMTAGLLFSIFVTLDRWLAATLLGAPAAAPYALASLTASALLVMPSVVSQQTYPRMAMAVGRRASVGELREMARKQGVAAALLASPVAAAAIAAAWFAVPVLFPDYAAAAPAIAVLSGGLIVLAAFTGYGNYLNVTGGHWRYLAVQAFALACSAIMMIFGGLWLGLVGIALGMSCGHLIYGSALRVVALRTAPRVDIR
jgi:O-antigen/teichoic acid export membrane protein